MTNESTTNDQRQFELRLITLCANAWKFCVNCLSGLPIFVKFMAIANTWPRVMSETRLAANELTSEIPSNRIPYAKKSFAVMQSTFIILSLELLSQNIMDRSSLISWTLPKSFVDGRICWQLLLFSARLIKLWLSSCGFEIYSNSFRLSCKWGKRTFSLRWFSLKMCEIRVAFNGAEFRNQPKSIESCFSAVCDLSQGWRWLPVAEMLSSLSLPYRRWQT